MLCYVYSVLFCQRTRNIIAKWNRVNIFNVLGEIFYLSSTSFTFGTYMEIESNNTSLDIIFYVYMLHWLTAGATNVHNALKDGNTAWLCATCYICVRTLQLQWEVQIFRTAWNGCGVSINKNESIAAWQRLCKLFVKIYGIIFSLHEYLCISWLCRDQAVIYANCRWTPPTYLYILLLDTRTLNSYNINTLRWSIFEWVCVLLTNNSDVYFLWHQVW